jgi:pimeloyl-ACP methyl ester carboxylesterase/integrase
MSYHGESAGVTGNARGARPVRLFDEVRRHMRLKHYSLRTEQAYLGWIRRFILVHGRRSPREMGGAEVEAFLSTLAVERQVAAGTQNQALSALLFLYRVVLGVELPWMENVVRAKRPCRVPTVLSQEEVRRLLASMQGRAWLLASLLYGTGMRLLECLRLRVKDVDFGRTAITVQDGKGGEDRRTILPRSLVEPMHREIERGRARTGRWETLRQPGPGLPRDGRLHLVPRLLETSAPRRRRHARMFHRGSRAQLGRLDREMAHGKYGRSAGSRGAFRISFLGADCSGVVRCHGNDHSVVDETELCCGGEARPHDQSGTRAIHGSSSQVRDDRACGKPCHISLASKRSRGSDREGNASRPVDREHTMNINPDRRRFFGTAFVAFAATQFDAPALAQATGGTTPEPKLNSTNPKVGNDRTFPPLKHIDAGVLNVGYAEAGPADGPVVVLLHGWPYDIHSFAEVTPLLVAARYRVIVPYLRGYGSTRFLSDATMRNAQQSALARDLIDLMDALRIRHAIIAGFDWGARTANIVAALWPERCKALVSVSGYLIGNQEAGKIPLPPKAELQWWYQYYFATDRGSRGYEKYRRDFAKLIWQIASPKWNFDEAAFDRTAAAFDNPDHVAIVIHNYRWRLGIAEGEAKYEELERRLAASPNITVPTITLEGDANGAPHPEPDSYARKFSSKYAHRTIDGGVGHNLPQEAPQAFAQAIMDVERL